MEVNRTGQIFLGYNENISNLCHLSKNLYNQANYILRQAFIKKERMPTYVELIKLFQIPSDNDEKNNYQKLPAQTAQWTIKKAMNAWNSFFKSIKEYKKHPEKFKGRPRPPHYKDGEFPLIFTNQQCRVVDGALKFSKMVNLEVRLSNDVDLREVRIVPQGTGYVVEIVYRKEIKSIADADSKKVMSIDFGIRNTVTTVDSIGSKPIAIKGGALNSINQWMSKFRPADGTIINADVNAAYNIMKKAILKGDGIEGVGLHPISIGRMITSKGVS